MGTLFKIKFMDVHCKNFTKPTNGGFTITNLIPLKRSYTAGR